MGRIKSFLLGVLGFIAYGALMTGIAGVGYAMGFGIHGTMVLGIIFFIILSVALTDR